MIAPILLTFAVKAESRPLQRRLPQPHPHLQILVTGIGARNAQSATHNAFSPSPPKLLLSCGFAGGLNPSLTAGTVIFSADDDFPLTNALLNAGARPATFHSSDRIVTSANRKRALHEETGADAVEMESATIRRICADAHVPSATVRVISDSANEDLPLDFNRYLDDMDRLRFAKMATSILFAPLRIRPVVQFQRQIQIAADNLARTLLQITTPT